MTSLESVELYTRYHSETFEEILQWPYRRYQKAFDAWQRGNALDEIESKKNLHLNALWSIVEWSKPEDQQKALEDIDNYYEMLKEIIWNPNKAQEENEEMQELEANDPFLAASKRNLKKIITPLQPNQEIFEDNLE